MGLNKRVKGKGNLKDDLADNKRASPNNEQLAQQSGEAGDEEGRAGSSASTCLHVLWLIEAFGIKQPQNGTLQNWSEVNIL